MSHKLVEAYYNKETGFSYAKIRTELGDFEGKAMLHDEDKDIASKYAGCQYAETRAVLKYMKKRINILAYQIKALINCQKQIEGRAAYNPQSVEGRALRKQIFILQAERKDWQSKYLSLKDKLYFAMSNRKKIVEEMISKKEGEKE